MADTLSATSSYFKKKLTVSVNISALKFPCGLVVFFKMFFKLNVFFPQCGTHKSTRIQEVECRTNSETKHMQNHQDSSDPLLTVTEEFKSNLLF